MIENNVKKLEYEIKKIPNDKLTILNQVVDSLLLLQSVKEKSKELKIKRV